MLDSSEKFLIKVGTPCAEDALAIATARLCRKSQCYPKTQRAQTEGAVANSPVADSKSGCNRIRRKGLHGFMRPKHPKRRVLIQQPYKLVTHRNPLLSRSGVLSLGVEDVQCQLGFWASGLGDP